MKILLAMPTATVLMMATTLAQPPKDMPLEVEILFTSKKGSVYHLFVMNPDGTKVRQLTKAATDHLFPAWSQDGKQIIYSAGKPFERQHLYVMNADGTGAKQITEGDVSDRGAIWSPDGKRILFGRREGLTGNDHEICLMDFVDGKAGKVVNLTQNKAWDSDPTWSPDGKKIVFVSNRDQATAYRLYVMDVDGKNVKAIAERGVVGGFVYPTWSPDGKKIAFTDSALKGKEIFICDPDGTNRQQLTNLGGLNSYAAWSLQSDRIVFQYHPSTSPDGILYSVNVTTGETSLLSKDVACPREGGRPAWRPTMKAK